VLATQRGALCTVQNAGGWGGGRQDGGCGISAAPPRGGTISGRTDPRLEMKVEHWGGLGSQFHAHCALAWAERRPWNPNAGHTISLAHATSEAHPEVPQLGEGSLTPGDQHDFVHMIGFGKTWLVFARPLSSDSHATAASWSLCCLMPAQQWLLWSLPCCTQQEPGRVRGPTADTNGVNFSCLCDEQTESKT
jgi:hypothetical protein